MAAAVDYVDSYYVESEFDSVVDSVDYELDSVDSVSPNTGTLFSQ